ncbi:MAG: hypothetical protein Q4E87_07830 [bacterium]|nr:hypothetical protein [bacterium]
MGLFDFFTRNAINEAMMAQNAEEEGTTFEATANRGNLKNQLALQLMGCGFTQLEVKEVLDVIALAEADIKIAEDSLAHVNINNPDPTRSMHAAIEQIRQYKKEAAYNVRKKIMEIIARKQQMGRM